MSAGNKCTEASRIKAGVIGVSTQSTVFLEEPAVVLEGWWLFVVGGM
jgi:hypothetical protein